jgi:rhamnosyltransferase subunit B
MGWRRALWRFIEKGWIDPVAIAQINAAREPLGLSKIHSFLTHIAKTPDLSAPLFPSWFAPPASLACCVICARTLMRFC